MSNYTFQDWHVHNFVSHDALGDVEDFVIQAIGRNIKRICFVNHPERPVGGIFDYDLKSLISKLEKEKKQIEYCMEKYNGEIEIYQGIELENRSSLISKNRDLISAYKFDIVFGSCHLIDDISVSSKRNLDFFENHDKDYVYKRYFENLLEMFNQFDFNVLAHLDIVKRYGVKFYGKFEWNDYIDYIDEVLSIMAEKNIGIEINTSGIFQDPGETYPAETLVSYALDKGVPFAVTGSDSHSPKNIGKGFNFLDNIEKYNKNLILAFN